MKVQTRISHKVLQLLAIIALSISSIAAAAPGAFTADVAVTDIFPGNQPHGQFHVRITNHGPGTLNNVHADIFCGYDSQDVKTGMMGPKQQKHISVTLNLNPGQSQEFPTSLSLDTSVYEYQVGCDVQVGFNDPNPSNNFYDEQLQAMGGTGVPGGSGKPGNNGQFTADIAVTDIYPDNQPHGQFFVRITNRGPGTLQNVKVTANCTSDRTDKNNGQWNSRGIHIPLTLNLQPGQQQAFATGINLDTNVFSYLIFCEVQTGFDPVPVNNVYAELFQ